MRLSEGRFPVDGSTQERHITTRRADTWVRPYVTLTVTEQVPGDENPSRLVSRAIE